MSGDATLFEESFTVTEYDQSKYDRVARISCTSSDSQTIMTLDINIELFPCAVSDTLHVVLSTTLALDGTKDDDKGWRDVGKNGDAPATIADLYDYVCYGKVYKFEETYDGSTMCVFSSCFLRRVASSYSSMLTLSCAAMPLYPLVASSCPYKAPSRSSPLFAWTMPTCW